MRSRRWSSTGQHSGCARAAEAAPAAVQWNPSPEAVLDFTRSDGAHGLRCIVNFGSAAVDVPPGEVLLSSEPLVDRTLPPAVAAWLAVSAPAGATSQQ